MSMLVDGDVDGDTLPNAETTPENAVEPSITNII